MNRLGWPWSSRSKRVTWWSRCTRFRCTNSRVLPGKAMNDSLIKWMTHKWWVIKTKVLWRIKSRSKPACMLFSTSLFIPICSVTSSHDLTWSHLTNHSSFDFTWTHVTLPSSTLRHNYLTLSEKNTFWSFLTSFLWLILMIHSVLNKIGLAKFSKWFVSNFCSVNSFFGQKFEKNHFRKLKMRSM